MTTRHGILTAAILLAGLILAAGCATSSSPAPVPPAGTTIVPITSALPVSARPVITTIAPAQCPLESNSTVICINPVPHHYFGETITFDGTTNLPAGETITIRIAEAWGRCSKCQFMRNDSVRYCCGNFYRMVAVRPGDSGVNTWSWDVNTSDYDFQPDGNYLVSASGRERLVENTSYFRLNGIPQPNITFTLPENDPNEYAIRFSGQVNTGNGPDENLLFQITSDSGSKVSYTIPVYRNGTGYYWNFTLKKSAITPYNFYTVNLSSLTSPEIGYRNTFMYNNLPGYY
jgi:hypothetical protein